MKPPIRAMLAAVFIALLVAVVGSTSLTDSVKVAPLQRVAALPHALAFAGAESPRPPEVIGTRYTATAYCQRGVTRSGVNTRPGIVAADPDVLPVGSVVHIESKLKKYSGVYTVLDTGSKVQGRRVDLFVPDCDEAVSFGKRPIRVKVIRTGWSPKATSVDAQHDGRFDAGRTTGR